MNPHELHDLWMRMRQMLKENSAKYARWKAAAPTLTALGLHSGIGFEPKMKYSVMPDSTYFPIWAFQHQKAIIDFVKATDGDYTDSMVITDAANYLWYADPKIVEKNLN